MVVLFRNQTSLGSYCRLAIDRKTIFKVHVLNIKFAHTKRFEKVFRCFVWGRNLEEESMQRLIDLTVRLDLELRSL